LPHLIAGLILTGLGLWGMVTWWNLFGLVMRGVMPFMLLVFGLIAILASIRRMSRAASAASYDPAAIVDLPDDAGDLLADKRPSSGAIDPSAAAERELIERGLVPAGR
jgi:hypothetical protein